MGKLLLGALIFSVLPIWRQGSLEPLILWELIPAQPHIPVAQALTEVKAAWITK